MERITVDPNQMSGEPCIRGLRIPVATVVQMLAEGMSVGRVCELLPDLEPADVTAALQFAAAAVRERQIPLVGAA